MGSVMLCSLKNGLPSYVEMLSVTRVGDLWRNVRLLDRTLDSNANELFVGA